MFAKVKRLSIIFPFKTRNLSSSLFIRSFNIKAACLEKRMDTPLVLDVEVVAWNTCGYLWSRRVGMLSVLQCVSCINATCDLCAWRSASRQEHFSGMFRPFTFSDRIFSSARVVMLIMWEVGTYFKLTSCVGGYRAHPTYFWQAVGKVCRVMEGTFCGTINREGGVGERVGVEEGKSKRKSQE